MRVFGPLVQAAACREYGFRSTEERIRQLFQMLK
jgi:hypothetical protein